MIVKNRIKVNKNKIYNVYILFYFCWISLCVKLQDVSLLIVIYRQLSFTKKNYVERKYNHRENGQNKTNNLFSYLVIEITKLIR